MGRSRRRRLGPGFAYFIMIVATIFAGVVLLAGARDAGAGAAQGCQPWEWELPDCRVTAWDGRNLHGEPDHIRKLFWETWGVPAGETDLTTGVHVRRWRWEYERENPPPATAQNVRQETVTPKPRASAPAARSEKPAKTNVRKVTPVQPSAQPSKDASLSERWPECYRFLYWLDPQVPPHGSYPNGNEYIRRKDAQYPLGWECQRGPS